jgi:uncharacterized protein
VSCNRAAPRFHVIRGERRTQVLVVPHSRLYEVDDDFARDLERREALSMEWLDDACRTRPGEVPLDHVDTPAPQSISLNVSSSCNLACAYCYAEQGAFGGAQSRRMDWSMARAAIDRLFEVADPRVPITIGFLGGEPFSNAPLVHRSVEYASHRGRQSGRDVRFATTTNGTLLHHEDRELLRDHGFAVTVSVDGPAGPHDLQRPSAGGASSFAMMFAGVRELLECPGRARLAARATVTRSSLDLSEAFGAIVELGFPEVGFSPLRGSPTMEGVLRDDDWGAYLDACIALSRSELAGIRPGRSIRFTNLAVALKQIHRSACSPYPCGAGGGYFSVGANGQWYACHRAIGDPEYRLGDSAGLDLERRKEFVVSRHVHSKTECRQCWARYLCSGSCHQEAPHRTGASCDFIRAWLEFAIEAYAQLLNDHPEWFAQVDKKDLK